MSRKINISQSASLRVGVEEDNHLSSAESPDAALSASDVRSTTSEHLML